MKNIKKHKKEVKVIPVDKIMKLVEGNKFQLNVACGQTKIEGYTGIDVWEGADIVHNLENFPWPFEDNSVDVIYCSHYVEHTTDLCKFMDECYRILKVGSAMTVLAPYYTSVRCWQDPTHKRAISEVTFLYFNKQWRDGNKLDHYGIKSDFDFNYGYIFNPLWVNRHEEARAFALQHYFNVVSDIQVNLVKKG